MGMCVWASMCITNCECKDVRSLPQACEGVTLYGFFGQLYDSRAQASGEERDEFLVCLG
jgi:hypothetical protein